jgi:hypothetical protein
MHGRSPSRTAVGWPISHTHARSFGAIAVAAVIHHGIDLETHQRGPETDG